MKKPAGQTDLNNDLIKAHQLHMAGQLKSAQNLYGKILSIEPDNADALHLNGLIAFQLRNFEKAENLIQKAIKKKQDFPAFYQSIGTVYKYQGKLDKALASFLRSHTLCPENPDALYEVGNIHYKKGAIKEAEECMKTVILKNNSHINALFRMASIQTEIGNYKKSNAYIERLLKINPRMAQAHNNMGLNHKAMGNLNKAVLCFEKAVTLNPDMFQAIGNMANVYQALGRFGLALKYLKKTLEINPANAEAHYNKGIVLQHTGKVVDAITCYDKALSINPGLISAYNNKGVILQHLGKISAAKKCFKTAIDLEPANAPAWHNLGILYSYMEQYKDAIFCEERALEADPTIAKVWVFYRDLLIQTGTWEKAYAISDKVTKYTQQAIKEGQVPPETPFQNIVRVMDPEENYVVARAWGRELERKAALSGIAYEFEGRLAKKNKITVGYLSNNFRDHPTAHLIQGLFSFHDRSRFSANCYSYGENDRSNIRKTIMETCDRFVDIQGMDDIDASKQIFNDHVDILVDLHGHTACNRMDICALQPAPIQVRYLGMAGTTGADFFDYLISDKIVTPEIQAQYYSEAFVYMPDCYQVNDQRQKRPECKSKRKDHDLPEKGFVFGCFGTNYKIDPDIVNTWIRVLKTVPDSVLWLLQRSEIFMDNLKDIFLKEDVPLSRIIFAEPLPRKKHLERLAHCDLVFDTRNVNGAATTSDAIWAGVPVLTVKGKHFASRMSASILTAMGLEELITDHLKAYEKTAVRIALHRDLQNRLKEKIEKNITVKPLFNTRRFVKHLEQAFEKMVAIARTGSQPSNIDIKLVGDCLNESQ